MFDDMPRSCTLKEARSLLGKWAESKTALHLMIRMERMDLNIPVVIRDVDAEFVHLAMRSPMGEAALGSEANLKFVDALAYEVQGEENLAVRLTDSVSVWLKL